VKTLEEAFTSTDPHDDPAPPDQQTQERWRSRYFAGLQRLRETGIDTIEDEARGAETCVSLRTQWVHDIRTLAPMMAYSMDEIDCAGEHISREPRFFPTPAAQPN
jgi:hypothetical protein